MKSPEQIFNNFRDQLNKISDKEERIREIVEFSTIYGDNYGSKILSLIEEGILLARDTGNRVGEILCYCHLGFANRVTGVEVPGKYSYSLAELTEMVNELKPVPEMFATALNLISYFHWFRGEYDKAFNLAFEAVKINDDKAVIGKAWNHFGLAVFYFDTKDFDNARTHYQKALDTFVELGHDYGKARASNGLGTVCIIQNRIGEALTLLEFAAAAYTELNHHAGLSRAINDLGLLEKSRGNPEAAISYLEQSIALRSQIMHLQGLITSYTELGETYLQIKDYNNALIQLEKGLNLAVEIKAQQKEMRLHKLLYDLYKPLGKTENALMHFEKYFEVRTNILSDEAANNIKKVQTQFEKEKSEQEAELERFKNVELKKANTIIEQKNKDITDSINYARRIQYGILPSGEFLDECFEKYFVLYKPKDIVSGDFYWAGFIKNETGKQIPVIAAVDCTGHGVPGAFMSMLGYILLNQTVLSEEINNAAEILDALNRKLPENLKSSGDQHIRDGMDIALCIIDRDNMQLQYAGANNPCWILRSGELLELKADKQPISASTETNLKGFSNQQLKLHEGDLIYLFTDGFADQFGGPDEKKFGYKRLRELLIANAGRSMDSQKEILLNNFMGWKGELEQIDDVCVIGVRV